MTQTNVDAIAHNSAIAAHSIGLNVASPDIEIDSTSSGIYRVWKSMTFIGIVRRCDRTLCWIAKPASDCSEQPYLTSDLAIRAVVRAWEAV